jgi:hypothetical protein
MNACMDASMHDVKILLDSHEYKYEDPPEHRFSGA